MERLIFEQLQEKDIIQLRDISDEFADLDSDEVKTFLAKQQNIAFTAKLNGKVIGLLYGYSLDCFDGTDSMFYIYSLDIHTDYQNKSYGSKFVRFAVDWARGNGFYKCYVYAEEDNVRACRIYEKICTDVINEKEFSILFDESK
jgi:ribosomal protein S18 acetylase RimI-like enzyme